MPPTYLEYQILEDHPTIRGAKTDRRLYSCAKAAKEGSEPIVEFGGAFSFHFESDHQSSRCKNLTNLQNSYKQENVLVNPITGGLSCEEGFTVYPVLGAGASDTISADACLHRCARSRGPGESLKRRFGGMYGSFFNRDKNDHEHYLNPVTNAFSCPATYTTATMTFRANYDYTTASCLKPLAGQ